MNETILRYQSGTVAARREKPLLREVSFSLRRGETLALVGETGSGKTMIARSILRLLPGDVTMRGASIRFGERELCRASSRAMQRLRGSALVYIPQNGLEFLNPARSIGRQLGDSLQKLGIPAAERERQALQRLRDVGFAEPEALLSRYPFQLSGGMAQRVTIALAACSRAELVIADEPTNGLDEQAVETFWALLPRLFPKAGILVITHDMQVAARCDSLLVLCGGRLLEKGGAKAVLSAPRHPYTQALLQALVKNGMNETPLLRRQEGDCPFYRRCPKAGAGCMHLRRQEQGAGEWWCA